MEYDAVVVGGGPAGSVTARFAAESGVKVIILERRTSCIIWRRNQSKSR